MKKEIMIASFILLCIGNIYAQSAINDEAITIGSKVCTLDTLEHRRIGPGTTYTSFYVKELPAYVYILKLDMHNPYNSVETFLANDKIGGTELVTSATKRSTSDGHKTYCGINGDFFNVADHKEYPLGSPRGGSAKDGVMQREPRNSWWSIAAIDKNKIPIIDHVEFAGTVDAGTKGTYNFYDVNVPRAYCNTCEMTFFNHYAGGATRLDENYAEWMGVERTEVYLTLAEGESWKINQPVKCIVGKTIENVGGNAIGKDESVLSGVGNARAFLQQLQPGDEITVQMGIRSTTYNTYPEITQMIGGNAVILRDGVATARNETEAYNATNYPRTIVGSSADKRWMYLLVADGKTTRSRGLTTLEVCDILKHWGATDAVGLDGGGSSEMIVNYAVANKPADGKERSVGNGWLVVDTSEESDEITELDFWNHKLTLPRYAIIKPVVMGFNKYGRLLNEDLDGIELSCSSELGHIDDDGNFVASGTATSGLLTAKYGSLEATKLVTVMNGSDFKIRLDSVLLDDKAGYPIEVFTQLSGKDVLIDHNAFNWSVANQAVCTVDRGILNAVSNGTSQVEGSLNDFKGQLKVNVEITDEPQLPIISFNDESIALVSNISGITKTAADYLTVNYNYTSTRAPYFQLEKKVNLYSKPQAIRIVYNPTNLPISKITVTLSANNQSASIVKEFANIVPNSDNTIEIPIEELVDDMDDIAIWPIKLNSFKVALNASGHTVGNPYSLDLKQLSALYANDPTGVIDSSTLIASEMSIAQEDDKVYLKLNLTSPDIVSYEVYSLQGTKLLVANLGVCKSGSYLLDGDLMSGQIYLLNVKHGSSSSVFKFIKQ